MNSSIETSDSQANADERNSAQAVLPNPRLIFPVVGIGASAGGLEAFSQLLANLDVKTGMAFVLIQHLDPSHESLLSEILAKTTTMPVTEAKDDMVIEANSIYVLPPNTCMTVSADQLKISPRSKDGRHFPIDDFFHSLAQEYRENSVGVVLSGTGSDGSEGLTSISAEGGITFAQERASAKFDGMPAAAIAVGVDFILTPKDIAGKLATLARTHAAIGTSVRNSGEKRNEEAPNQLEKIFALLRAARGMDFSHYKRPTVERRISRRMGIHRLEKLEDYVAFLRANPFEIDNLFEDILIKVTCFFRDPESFASLKDKVYPAILKGKSLSKPFRIWVPGCATGEEAYSIAISLLEFMEETDSSAKIEIFATDISDTALAKARFGEFDESIAERMSSERLQRFFTKEGFGYRVVAEVRECCLFAKQNVCRDPPFSKLDLISCRNLLIYLTPGVQKRIIATFHFALNPGGFLILGNSETIGADTDLFEVHDKASKISIKKPGPHGRLAADFEMSVSNDGPIPASLSSSRQIEPLRRLDLKGDAEQAILTKHVAPGVVINERMDILQFRGDTSPYLAHSPGEATVNLLKMCRSGLLADVRRALSDATASGEPIKKDGWLKTAAQSATPVAIDVIPFTASSTTQRYFVVLFGPRAIPAREKAEDIAENHEADRHLLRELAETKEYLNSIIEKEQASNEELKAASEEILSANEELQSTNEELSTAKEETQAVNEELQTVNEELKTRNNELAQANSDLANLFGSVQIPIVMLSVNLAVRRFTPPAEKALNLNCNDLGKSLAEFGSRLKVDGLERLASEVLETLNTKDEEVQDRDGRWYSLRIKPYRTIDNRIDGTIIALVDIDSMKRSFDRLREAYNYADAIIQTAPVPLLVLDDRLHVVTANQAFCEHFHVNQAETKGVNIYDLGNGQWNVPLLRERLEEILSKNEVMENFVVDHNFPNLGRRIIKLSARKLLQHSDQAERVLLAFSDITEQRLAEEGAGAAKEAAETSNRVKSEFLANMSHEIRTPLSAILGYSELLANAEQSRAESLHAATNIRKNVEHLTELVDEILDIAKIEAGKLEVERIRVALLPELAETFASLQNRAESRSLALDVAFYGEIPEFVTTSPKHLRQIIINIIGNALKFTERGGVSIAIALEPFLTGHNETRLSIVVKDTGCGINEDQQKRLFQPFSQADSSVTRQFGGSGLGLTLARKLAQTLGGDVVLTDSQAGKGSTFTISVDTGSLKGVSMLKGLTKADLDRSEEAVSDWFVANQRLAGIRVLLVEDGPDNQALMTHFLSASGACVEGAVNGAEAIEKAQVGSFDIILMDIQMPVLDGYEATRRLRAKGYKSPIVALTAHAMQGERERCLAAGCVDYMSKPVKPPLLIEVVERAIKKKDLKSFEMSGNLEVAYDKVVEPYVAQFVGNLPQRVAALLSAKAQQDYREIENQAHQMAGAAQGYGFPKIGRVAAKIEALARARASIPDLARTIEKFNSLCEAAVRGTPPLH